MLTLFSRASENNLGRTEKQIMNYDGILDK